jgi:tRNA(adenine34) deaminase
MLVIREATTALKNERLVDCNLYVTLEPCPMCAGAISLARIKRLYYGAADEKGGGAEHGIRLFSHPSCHHRPEVYGGIEEIACATILQSFFATKRQS